MATEFETFTKKNRKDKIMYYLQYYNPITLTWQEIRQTYKTVEEVNNVAYSYGAMRKLRIVEYVNGERKYTPYN